MKRSTDEEDGKPVSVFSVQLSQSRAAFNRWSIQRVFCPRLPAERIVKTGKKLKSVPNLKVS